MKEGLLVGLAVAFIWFVEKMLGTSMVNRPIVISSLAGLALGDLHQGIIIGASLELVFMGAIQVGAAVPPELLVGTALGTAFAITSGQGAEIALTLGLPIAILAQSLKVLVFIIRSWFMDYAVSLAKKANIRGMFWLNMGGLLLQCSMYFIVVFLALYFGAPVVQSFVENIPETLMHGLEVAGKLLPAVGFALILQPMMNKHNFLYFILGFVMLSYLELPIMAITIFGIVLAFVIVFEGEKASNQHDNNGENEDELEALFND
ncbi:PTS mannose/fructose/sorbose/N-acetylgalactosamine transporter subunit IIC [Allofustis seminis]|uniref:PTS mannose/fructose/sorbose/N-acetylgalactosamine transporter subunit IIC n=1 Tax=Allofustis seminis TaxID=166939 RepID=UPI000363AD75|nr:PTS sugar transporter subunit IIC [Allofustis seminis]